MKDALTADDLKAAFLHARRKYAEALAARDGSKEKSDLIKVAAEALDAIEKAVLRAAEQGLLGKSDG